MFCFAKDAKNTLKARSLSSFGACLGPFTLNAAWRTLFWGCRRSLVRVVAASRPKEGMLIAWDAVSS
jgi:hypothetical protein